MQRRDEEDDILAEDEMDLIDDEKDDPNVLNEEWVVIR